MICRKLIHCSEKHLYLLEDAKFFFGYFQKIFIVRFALQYNAITWPTNINLNKIFSMAHCKSSSKITRLMRRTD